MPTETIRNTPGEQAFSISVILEYSHQPKHSRGGPRGEVVGVLGIGGGDHAEVRARLIHSGDSADQYLWSGFKLKLFQDDVESYYCNLMGEKPGVFVVLRQNREGTLAPVLVTLSYDEATSHLEVDDQVSSVTIPPDIYRRVETFVLEPYVPEPRKKRKRKDWKNGSEPS